MIIGGLVLLHRWLGIAFCLLFAMWFATGIVMHVVPFPSLTEAERFEGLAQIDSSRLTIGPRQAVAASGVDGVTRLRLIQRSDGPVYLISAPLRLTAVRASDATEAGIASPDHALAEARHMARRRGLDVSRAEVVGQADYDQWTVPNGFDRHRPLFRIALNDGPGTELYVSSRTGEIVLDATRSERGWNYVGSVAHWIYPTVLRSDWRVWDAVVWMLSLIAAIAAIAGAVLGVARLRVRRRSLASPYRGWHAVHHVLGLVATLFVLTWILSGWLSMDHGRLFSRDQLTEDEARMAIPPPVWSNLPPDRWASISRSAREVEWFAFAGVLYRRDRVGLGQQGLWRADAAAPAGTGELDPRDMQAWGQRLSPECSPAAIVASDDHYASTSALPGTPVYRLRCGDVWFDIDGASGTVLQRLDASRRAYRWLYGGLHRLDFPPLNGHPHLRSALVVGLCTIGLAFSLTGVVIGYRRLRTSFGG